MYSPWTNSMPCLISSNQYFYFDPSSNHDDCLMNSSVNLDLSNPFNFVAAFTSTKNPLAFHHDQHRQSTQKNFFEPLPFLEPEKQINYPQLSQKHNIIKQMISRKNRSNFSHQSSSNSCENVFSSSSQRQKRRICSFCKSNGESASVYTSHVLRNNNNEIECPVLMAYVCPKCGATGKMAHTIKYCPSLSESERVALPTIKTLKEGRSSSGNQNLFKKSF